VETTSRLQQFRNRKLSAANKPQAIPRNKSSTSLFGCSMGPDTPDWESVMVEDILNSDSDMSFNDNETTASIRTKISGVVYGDAKDGDAKGRAAPIVTVRLASASTSNDNDWPGETTMLTTTTDEAGRFSFRDMPPGSYTVSVVETEALPIPADMPRDRLGPMTVQVASGGKAERMVFGFDAPGPSGGLGKGMGTAVARTSAMKKPLDIAGMKEDMNIVLSSKNKDGVDDDDSDSCSTAELSVLMGRVYDDRTNEGAKGVTVYLVDIASKNPTKESVRTDTDGHYTFADIRPSTYVIRIAEMSMSMYGPVYDDGASRVPANNLSTQKIVAVCNGDEYPGVDFGYHRLEEDVYSLLFFARDPDMIRAALAYLFVFVVFCVQVSLLTLMLIDIQFYSLGRWSWSNSLPHITIPVYASRALVCIVAAVFQSALIALTRDLFSGYGAVFPHQTVIKRINGNAGSVAVR